VSVNDLAAAVEPDPSRIVHVEHIHPQSEIAVLRCDARLARRLLGWQPEVTLTDGLAQVRSWMSTASGRPDRRVTGRVASGSAELAIDGGATRPFDPPAVRPPDHRLTPMSRLSRRRSGVTG